jgi:prepilin-type N-terminal cleavage/methylation domain-containing protein
MPTLSVGKHNSQRKAQAGITLLEMLVVMAIISLLAGISFPAISAGLDSVRLASAANSVVSFLNAALNRAERRQQVMEVTISVRENALSLYSAEPGFERKLEMPDGVRIEEILPRLEEEEQGPRRFLLMPGGTAPRIGIQIGNRRGARRIVSVDPAIGMPQVEVPEPR